MDAPITLSASKQIPITLLASSFFYDDATDSYCIKFENARIVSNSANSVTLSVASNKIQSNCKTQQLKGDDIDTILNDMETKAKNEKRPKNELSQKAKLTQKLSSIPKPRKETKSEKQSNQKRSALPLSITKEWQSCFECEDECAGNNGAGCVAMQRIKFIMEHYSNWMRCKTVNDTVHDSDVQIFCLYSDDSSDGDSSDDDDDDDDNELREANGVNMKNYEWMSHFFKELGTYSYVELSDDFEHIRDFHMKLNKKKTIETIAYFDALLGKCEDKQCGMLARHCRDRHIDNVNEEKRRHTFFICESAEDKKIKNMVRENAVYSEINLQTKLDTIHITLRHHHLRLINTDKFITKIFDAANKNDDEDEDENIFCKMTKYSFGESITYWDAKHHRYCNSQYADLRTELLQNKIYSLSPDLYATIRNRAILFLSTRKGKALKSLREHDWMKKWKILKHSVITIDHIVALLCYVNVTALRRVFKLHGFVRCKKEKREVLLSRHREIWHWSRLLLECVHCYGHPLSLDFNYYHGIDCKLLFNRFNVMFDIPTSLTLNRDIAYNLSRSINYGRGIAIELEHGGLSDLQSLCLDLSHLSDYPSEEEQLVFHSYLSFNDVIINRMHHDEWLKILRFWYKIKEGFFFNHLIQRQEISRNDQLCICAMIINMIIANDKHPRYDNRIPPYMQRLFNECVEEKTFVWIVRSEYTKMIKKLQNLLHFDQFDEEKSSQFVKYLIKHKKCNVCNANIFEWNVQPKEFKNLFARKSKLWISSPQYTVYMNSNSANNANNDYFKFHFEAQNKAKNNLFRVRIHLDYKPENVAKINLGMGLFCKAANNFDNYSYGELRFDKLFNVSLHSLFETKLLKKSCKKKTFTLMLQIQIFYVYDFDGKLISINQSQQRRQSNQYYD